LPFYTMGHCLKSAAGRSLAASGRAETRAHCKTLYNESASH
jgi:hypothetical protein